MSIVKTVLFPPPVRDSTLSKSELKYLFSIQYLIPIWVVDTTLGPEVIVLPNAGLDNSQTGQSAQDQEIIIIKGTADASTVTINGATTGTVILVSRGDFGRFKSDGVVFWGVGVGSSTVPVSPISFPKIPHEFLDSFNSGTGLFTASQPAAEDLSNGVIGTGAVVLASALPAATNFVDNETPSGTINSANVTFTLAFTPSPAGSLELFYNGLVQKSGGTDFTLVTNTITFASAPITGSTLLAWYRR